MSAQWYFQIDDQPQGPLSAEQLRQLVQEGRVHTGTLVTRQGLGKWLPAGKVHGLFPAPAATSPPTPAGTTGPAMSAASTNPVVPTARPTPEADHPPAVRPTASPTQSLPLGLPLGVPLPAPGAAVPVNHLAANHVAVNHVAVNASVDSGTKTQRRRSPNRSTKWVVIGSIAALLSIAAVIIVVVAPDLLRVGDAQPSAVRPEPPDGGEPDDVTSRPNAGPAVDAIESQTPATTSDEQQVPASSAPDRDQQVLARVTRWSDFSKVTAVQVRGVVMLRVVAVWQAPLPGSTGTSQVAPSPSSSSGSGPSTVTFVKLSVSNLQSDASLPYRSWNGSDAANEDTAAVMVDDQGNILPIVLRDQFSSGRIQQQDVAVGDTVTDVLVFRSPAATSRYVRLALPWEAVGRSSGCFGVEIPRAMITNQPSSEARPPLAENRDAPAPVGRLELTGPQQSSTPVSPEQADAERVRAAREALKRGINGEPQDDKKSP
jgi:hypothetical protein